jgi:hypothetical protein
MGKACSTQGERTRNEYMILVGKLEGKRQKIDLREIGWGGMGWIHLAQDRDQWRALVNMGTNFGFHKMLGSS